jgi:hypothetical protein
MRVLGKPEFDDAVRYNELELLLRNFGVHKSSQANESYSDSSSLSGSSRELEREQTHKTEKSLTVNDSAGVLFIEDTIKTQPLNRNSPDY